MILKFFTFIFLLTSSFSFADYKYQLSVCTIFRDEAPYLKEWIEFHRMLGVEHFYLQSHASIDNYKEILWPYIKDGIVSLEEISEEPNADLKKFCFGLQINWYNKILNESKGVSKWVAFLDSDEFLFPIVKSSLVDFLKNYENIGGIVVNWRMFGTSHIERLNPKNLMIEQLIYCSLPEYSINEFYKTILQPIHAINFPNPHVAIYENGYTAINPGNEKIVINHYWTRDEDFFMRVKVPRQLQLNGDPSYAFSHRDSMNMTKDFKIYIYIRDLKKIMKFRD